ncbi:MAG: alanine racemase [Lachnospiraceae bacterium]|nr:alanine racemase [Lachnospiraceae bacterium]
MKKFERVYATVDMDALRFNMESMRSNIDPETKMMAVIKTNAYGHGAIEVAKEIEATDYLFGYAVAVAEEALELRKAGIKKPILILGYTFPETYECLIENDVRPAVFREDQAEELSKAAVKLGKTVHFHLAVDTGMSRIGVRPDVSSLELVKKMAALPNVEMEGVFTHFAKADMTDTEPTEIQIEKFRSFIELLEKNGVSFKIHHCSNSAGLIRFKDANMDMVRAGITLYGLWPSDEVERDIVPLKPLLALKSHIVYIKYTVPGAGVSYGGTYTAGENTRIATIPVGYGDGYPRMLSNKGYVLIHGKKAPIIGRVCMDQFMVDVTGIPEASEGDEVTLIGRDGAEEITMEELGEISGRFNYELACDLGRRIPRIYLKRGKVVSVRDEFDKCFQN